MNLIPYNEDYERAVIVGVLSDPRILPKVQELVEPIDFYKDKHQKIYKAILSIEPDNLDSLSVEDKIKHEEDTLTYFKELVRDADKLLPSLGNVQYYAESIKGKSKLRAGIELGREISAVCYSPNTDPDEALSSLEQLFAKFLQQRVLENRIDSTSESFKRFVAELGTRIEDESGVKTGFYDLDLMLHRMEGLIIVAARPGMGKTAFAVNVTRNVMAQNKPVLFFSVEQSREQIFERMISAESEVPLEDVRTGAYIGDKISVSAISAAERILSPLFEKVHVDERADIPTSYITSLARQKKYEWGELGLIVVDYLHILRLNNQPKVDALGDATKELRSLGKELGCPILLLAQLNRANEQRTEGKTKNRRPELTDLRSSGEIEQSADVVIFLYRDGYYNSVEDEPELAEVIVKKHRNGRQGIILLDWYPSFVRFKNPKSRK